MLLPHRSPRHLNVARAGQQHHLAHAVPLQEGELERGELLLPYDTRGRTLRDRAQERHGRSCRGRMRALHQRGPRKGAPAEVERRTAAHGRRCRAARRALQHHVRDRAAVPEGRNAAHRSSAAAARLHLVMVRARVEVTVRARVRARVRVRATAATHLHRLRAQRRRRATPQLANERVHPAQLRVAARRQPPQRRRQPLQPCLARRRLVVPDARLGRAHRQRRRAPAAPPAQRRRQRACLRRVAQRRARAVRLQPRHARRGNARRRQRRAQQRALRRAVGRRQARAPPVLPHRRAKQTQALTARRDHRAAHALAPHVAVGARVPHSMPAAAKPSVSCGASLRLTAAAVPSGHSPPSTARHAPCSATSADEHAVSTLTHGPCSPSANDTRPLAIDVVSPVTAYTDAGRLGASSAQSGRSIPTNTPPSPPSSVDRRAPDACSAAYAVSSSSRCCGSIAPDSAADTPNAVWSNRSASRTKPPCDTHAACTSLRAPTSTAADSVHRATGTAPTASPLACSIGHNAPAPPSHPPGQRPAAPRTHTRPPAAARAEPAAAAGTTTGCAPASCSSTCAAIARGVGCSNTSVGESASPVAARSRLDSSVAAIESIPASISGVLAVTLASASPVSSRTTRSTSASTWGCRCDAGSAASAEARGLSTAVAATGAATAEKDTSSMNRACVASATLSRRCPAPQGSGEPTTPTARASTLLKHVAYCSSEIAAMPR
eukprot:scaffold3832_cov69-Phaeocystis_antarctica.AAC.3